MIAALWTELQEKEITDYPFRRKGHRPHLTFASITEVEPVLLHGLQQISAKFKPLPLSFHLFGSFIKSDTFLLIPNFNGALTELHRKINALHSAAPFFTPDNWIPHITIANYLSQTQFAAVQQVAKQRLDPFMATMINLAIIQVRESDVAELQTYSF
ncbi:2'-5' RNA ligase superfamily protein [Terribacillus halophilus]|uniref:2'-5' RNA ligase superfamily protein n=1 Tax=Terribacillus halophilus TaxID=361279 RepID=A0A1G6SEG4_9BACI|nr:2'-5' RNA ligase family protein [Terribacillus halophilus]SDD15320.1 2'-5' RNA ligase superfamily protein [Terribacillus halophilus]